MPIFQAGSNETPDTSGLGGTAVTGNSATGHSNTTSSISINAEESETVSKTCRWHNYGDHPTVARQLQFSWALSGSITIVGALPDSTSASVSFLVQYTVDGGSNWLEALSRTYSLTASGTTSPSDSGSIDLDIGAGNTDLVEVRSRTRATGTSTLDPSVSADAEITASISDLQIEAEQLQTAPLLVAM